MPRSYQTGILLVACGVAASGCGGGSAGAPTTAPTVPAPVAPAAAGCVADAAVFPAGTHPSLTRTNACWDATVRLLRITASVSFRTPGSTALTADGDKEGFYWSIPAAVSKVLIDANVRVTGHFRMTADQTIEGVSRETSVIYGTATKAWARGPDGVEDPGTRCGANGQPAAVAGDDVLHDCEKWRYGGISVDYAAPTDVTYKVRNLTVENPRTYAITAILQRMDIDRVLIRNTRPGEDTQSNSDGFGGGPGSRISNSKIDTQDDSIKLYSTDMVVENVTIIHNRNGAPFQLGWAAKPAATFTLANVKVVPKPGLEGQRYNLGLFANADGTVAPTINITGLSAQYAADAVMWQAGAWRPLPLVVVRGASSVVRLAGASSVGLGPNIRLSAPQASILAGAGSSLQVSLGGQTSLTSQVTLGQPELVTGCADCPAW